MRAFVRLFRLVAAGALAFLAFAGTAGWAQDYPIKPVKVIVPYPPGGTADILARITSQYLAEHLGGQFVIDNRGGAGSNIGTEAAVNSLPDGYSLLIVSPANAINATLYKRLPFNFLRDIVAVTGIARVPNIMEVNPAFPAKTVAQFIAYGKANPGKINMASSGNGTSVHLSGELFMAMTGMRMTHVPYRGAALALTDLIAGTVDVMFDNLPSSIEFVRTGKLRALAVTTAERAEALPDVPTVGESVPGFEATAWFGIGAPKNTPAAVIAKLNGTVNAAFGDAKFKARLADLGGIAMPGNAGEFGKLLAEETEKWAKAVKFSGASIE
jgi:tripartite-type tricarboxylate transporter receptor subunit TctC